MTGCTIITPRIDGTTDKATPKAPFDDESAGFAEREGRWGTALVAIEVRPGVADGSGDAGECGGLVSACGSDCQAGLFMKCRVALTMPSKAAAYENGLQAAFRQLKAGPSYSAVPESLFLAFGRHLPRCGASGDRLTPA